MTIFTCKGSYFMVHRLWYRKTQNVTNSFYNLKHQRCDVYYYDSSLKVKFCNILLAKLLSNRTFLLFCLVRTHKV